MRRRQRGREREVDKTEILSQNVLREEEREETQVICLFCTCLPLQFKFR